MHLHFTYELQLQLNKTLIQIKKLKQKQNYYIIIIMKKQNNYTFNNSIKRKKKQIPKIKNKTLTQTN